MKKLQVGWTIFSALTASITCLASTVTSANAAGEAVGQFFGRAVILRNMIQTGRTTPTVVNVSVEEKTKTVMSAVVVYNTSTCAEITPGSWTINTKPKHGTDTLAPYKFKLTTGSCAGHKYTGAGIFYTSTGPASAARRDVTVATWTGGGFTQFDKFVIRITP